MRNSVPTAILPYRLGNTSSFALVSEGCQLDLKEHARIPHSHSVSVGVMQVMQPHEAGLTTCTSQHPDRCHDCCPKSAMCHT
jgi:hypothetical protein